MILAENLLPPGETVRVTTTDGQDRTIRVVSVDPSARTIRGENQAIDVDSIVAIERKEYSRAGTSALAIPVGIVLGALVIAGAY